MAGPSLTDTCKYTFYLQVPPRATPMNRIGPPLSTVSGTHKFVKAKATHMRSIFPPSNKVPAHNYRQNGQNHRHLNISSNNLLNIKYYVVNAVLSCPLSLFNSTCCVVVPCPSIKGCRRRESVTKVF